MKIWVFNHYASTPDQPTTGAYFLLKALSDKGADVTVFASGFNYYKRRDIKLNGHLLTRKEIDGNLTFQWIRTTPTSGRALSRIVNMISYAAAAFFVSLFKAGKPDIVIGVCPHPLAALIAWLISVLRGGKFIYEIRDIWPESMIEGKIISKTGFIARSLTHLQKFLYTRAVRIMSVLGRTDEYLSSIGIDPKKFIWLPNGVRIDTANLPAPAATPDGDIFTVMYIGGHAKYHALDDLIEAAKILQDQGQDRIRFALIGDGSEKLQLIEKARALNLRYVNFRDPVPRKDVLGAVGEASCFVICSRTMPIHRFGISPNKLCDSMLAGRPTIIAVPVASDMVTKSGAGIATDSANPSMLAQAIVRMQSTPASERLQMGINAQRYALANFDANVLAEKFLSELKTLTAR